MRGFAELIGRWPCAGALAEDLGVHYATVRQWKRRNSVPPRYWDALIQAAAARRIEGIDGLALMALAAIQGRTPSVEGLTKEELSDTAADGGGPAGPAGYPAPPVQP